MSPVGGDKSTFDRILDAGVFVPVGFLVTRHASRDDLAKAGRKQVAFARSLGRAAIKSVRRGRGPAQTAPTVTPTQPSASTTSSNSRTAPPLGVDGYDEMTARDIVALQRTCEPAQALWIKSQETAGKQRVTVLRAAQAHLDENG